MKNMAHIYIALVDTPGILAYLIRRFLGQKYIHVVISMDERLEEAYSFGRRNPRIPVFAGFEREYREKILRAFPTADYMVCELACSEAQKKEIRRRLREDYRRRWHSHYAVIGLLSVAWGVPFYQRDHYTCSSYIARLLEENHIVIADKHFSLVTPKDFYLYPDKSVVFEGSLAEFVRLTDRRRSATAAEEPTWEALTEQRVAREKSINRKPLGRMVEAYGR